MARQSLLSVVLGLDSRQFERGLTAAQRKVRNTANTLSSVGRGLSVGVTAPLVGIGASSFKVAADFELAMKKVKAVSGATGQEFAALQKNARDLGSSTVFSASQVSSLQLEFAKLGLSSTEITKATESTWPSPKRSDKTSDRRRRWWAKPLHNSALKLPTLLPLPPSWPRRSRRRPSTSTSSRSP